jgi:hypothetical protein
MPEITTCPDCAKNLRVPDELLGKKVRCPGCSILFIAQPGTGLPEKGAARAPARSEAIADRRAAPADRYDDRPRRRDEYDDRPRRRADYDDRPARRYDDEEDRPRRRRDEDYDDRPRRRYEDDYPEPRSEGKAWRGVRAGLNMVLISARLQLAWIGVGALGAGIMLILGVGLASSAASGARAQSVASGALGMGIGALVLLGTLGLIGLGSGVLRLVGMGMCMQVPPSRSGAARGLAIAAFCCACAYVLLNMAGVAVRGGIHSMQGGGSEAAVIFAMIAALFGMSSGFGWIGGMVNFAAFILWLLAMRSICAQLRNDDVAWRVIVYLIADIIFRVVAVVLFVVAIVSVGIGIIGAFGSQSGSGAAASAGAGVIVAGVIFGIIGLCYLVMCVWYVFVVQQVRDVVNRKLARL